MKARKYELEREFHHPTPQELEDAEKDELAEMLQKEFTLSNKEFVADHLDIFFFFFLPYMFGGVIIKVIHFCFEYILWDISAWDPYFDKLYLVHQMFIFPALLLYAARDCIQGQGPGKRLMNLKVIDKQSKEPNASKTFARGIRSSSLEDWGTEVIDLGDKTKKHLEVIDDYFDTSIQ